MLSETAPERAPAAGPAWLRSYRLIIRNRVLRWLWLGQSISDVGDSFFELAISWVVYTLSNSALQSAVVQVVWHLSDILFGPFSGVVADRWDRRSLMIVTNLLAFAITGLVALLMFVYGTLPSGVIFLAVFLLNSTMIFFATAHFAVLPSVVEPKLLTTASGVFTTVQQLIGLLSGPLAGLCVALLGSAWAIAFDALSFLVAALCIAVARLPRQSAAPEPADAAERFSVLRSIADGWRAIAGLPVLRTLVWLSLLLNVASFTGPLWPALVKLQLGGGAIELGMLSTCAVIGGIVGGVAAGALEHRFGAGRLVIGGWVAVGLCRLGVALSWSFALTAGLMLVSFAGQVVANVAFGALKQALSPAAYRGRIRGISAGLAVLAIPPSALLGGWLTDVVGVAPMFAAAGFWMLLIAALALLSSHIRGVRIGE